ncbi:MAG: hypothetical protein KDJ90_15770, partial [Nitratireductor sp.]|nr:hypothetical protein [Nitratireductor sp.]
VIIVDFRGLDTLGEISVVMVAGLAIVALIRIRQRPEPGVDSVEASTTDAHARATKEAEAQ